MSFLHGKKTVAILSLFDSPSVYMLRALGLFKTVTRWVDIYCNKMKFVLTEVILISKEVVLIYSLHIYM